MAVTFEKRHHHGVSRGREALLMVPAVPCLRTGGNIRQSSSSAGSSYQRGLTRSGSSKLRGSGMLARLGLSASRSGSPASRALEECEPVTVDRRWRSRCVHDGQRVRMDSWLTNSNLQRGRAPGDTGCFSDLDSACSGHVWVGMLLVVAVVGSMDCMRLQPLDGGAPRSLVFQQEWNRSRPALGSRSHICSSVR